MKGKKESCHTPHADPVLGAESGDEGQGQGSQTPEREANAARPRGSQPSREKTEAADPARKESERGVKKSSKR